MWEKLKSYIADERSLFSFLIILVGLASFWLGQASVSDVAVVEGTSLPRVMITQQNEASVQQAAVLEESLEMPVVASRGGTKYHRLDCPGAAQIKLENRVEFVSVLAAKEAGYTPASNCPGLE